MFARNPSFLNQRNTVKSKFRYNIRTLQHYNSQIKNIINSVKKPNSLQKKLIITACNSVVYCANHSLFNPQKKGFQYNKTIDSIIETAKPYIPVEIVNKLESVKTI